MRSSLLLLALTLTVGCTDKTDDSDVENGTEIAAFTGLSVDSTSLSLGVGETEQLLVMATYDDDSTQDVSAAAEYRVINASVADVSDMGRVTGLSAGSTDIEVSYQGEELTVRVTVSSAALRGEVTYAGWPVEGMPVALDGTDEVAVTDASGDYAFDAVAPGSYDVVVALPNTLRDRDDEARATVEAGGSERVDIAIEDVGYPTGPDSYEGNDLPGTAGPITVGTWQYHTLWAFPEGVVDGGDSDYFRVQVQAGVEYDIIADGLCNVCDTVIDLFEADGITPIVSNDDADPATLGSQITYTPEADGELVYRVESFDFERGVAGYFTGVFVHVDVDDDGISAYRDCDDTDPDISPTAVEVVNNGVDDDCRLGDATGTDANEPNDVRTQATPLPYVTGALFAGLPSRQAPLVGTLDDDDTDWLSIVIPANSASGFAFFPTVTTPSFTLSLDLFDSDGETELDALVNDTDSPKTLYLRVSGSGCDEYLAYAVDFGEDEDGDGDYPQDIADERDCAEGDPSRTADACED